MSGSVKSAALLLVCTLVLSSAQNVFFNRGSSTGQSTTSGCDVNGRPGTCKLILECPENVAHVRSRNREALTAARSNCGRRLVNGRNKVLLCCPENISEGPPPPAKFMNHPKCGFSDFTPGRIVGGEPVKSLKDFPWMAILKWPKADRNPIYRCGGAVINERWVLTAAHCITPDGPVSVHVRDLDLATRTEDFLSEPPADVAVERIFSHPEYRNVRHGQDRGLFSDIALLKLSSPLVFSDILNPICLPERRKATREYEQTRAAYIAGWGLTSFLGDASSVMRWATVNISDHLACQESYARTDAKVDDSEHICASGNDLKHGGCVPGAEDGSCRGGVDACEGDSGGPLMDLTSSINSQRFYAIGVVSFGTGCGNPDFPGLYTRVDHFLDWIAETVAGN